MNTFLLLLGLTVIYYIVLFYFDNKRKKAFQLTKNNAIGKTTEFPIIEQTKPENLFGSTEHLDEPTEIVAPTTIVQKAIAAKNVVYQHSTKNVTEDLSSLPKRVFQILLCCVVFWLTVIKKFIKILRNNIFFTDCSIDKFIK